MNEPDVVVVETGGGPDIYAYDYGGTGPDVLFLHATGMHGRMWDPVIARLADFRCVSVDARGHGRSGLGDSMEWAQAMGDIESVIEGLHLSDSLSAVGHSFGGCLAMMLEVANPGLFDSAWLYEPIIAPPGLRRLGGDNPMAATARRRREVFESTDAAFERYMSKPPFSHCSRESVRAYVDHGFEPFDGGVRLRCRAETEARTFEASTTDIFDRLSSISTAVTVVGSGDGGFPAAFVDAVAEALPNGKALHWPDRTHFGPLEDPVRVAESIRESL